MVNPPDARPTNSVSLIRGCDVFAGARQIVHYAADRADFSVRIINQEDMTPSDIEPGVVTVTLQNDTVIPYPPE